ncbi:hypothetical protein [Burkholderia cepacia]|uniref:hypothetical protein n=1 Tax=Burkholderia cepacia TaxID=292 RepID=UPI000AD046AB|nr:hypothetical protein [Burkholderia cepacia]
MHKLIYATTLVWNNDSRFFCDRPDSHIQQWPHCQKNKFFAKKYITSGTLSIDHNRLHLLINHRLKNDLATPVITPLLLERSLIPNITSPTTLRNCRS